MESETMKSISFYHLKHQLLLEYQLRDKRFANLLVALMKIVTAERFLFPVEAMVLLNLGDGKLSSLVLIKCSISS